MDDLSLALSEHGVNVKKPDYCESGRPWQSVSRGVVPTGLADGRCRSMSAASSPASVYLEMMRRLRTELHDVFYVCHEADLTTGSSMSYDDIPSPSTANESDTCLTIY